MKRASAGEALTDAQLESTSLGRTTSAGVLPPTARLARSEIPVSNSVRPHRIAFRAQVGLSPIVGRCRRQEGRPAQRAFCFAHPGRRASPSRKHDRLRPFAPCR